ncbi:MAG: CapA family protein [Acidobacteriota bacterium]
MSEMVQIEVRDRPSGGPSTEPRKATLAALGDLMLAGEWDAVGADGMAAALAALGPVIDADLVFANLEATAAGDGETIAKEPRLIGRPDTLGAALAALRIDVASLGNNHAFDACLGGFRQTRGVVEGLGITHLGAGENAAEAASARTLERSGLRFGFLAFTDVETRPSHVAGGADGYGVHPLEESDAVARIKTLRSTVDHVVVSLHWGVEYCHLPSPDQIRVARRLVDAGARLVIGHHAHVVQGVESYGGGVIAYNLGNALTTDLEINGRLAIRQSAKMRSSFALRARFSPAGIDGVELIPFYAGRGEVRLRDRGARRRLEAAQRGLAEGVDAKRWKRVRLYEDVVLRTLKKLHPSVIGSVRPHHFAKFFRNIAGASSGRGPAA